jgi:hypothetical protein
MTRHCADFASRDFHWNAQETGASTCMAMIVQMTTVNLPMVTLMRKVYHSLTMTTTKHHEYQAASRDNHVTEEISLQHASECRQLLMYPTYR